VPPRYLRILGRCLAGKLRRCGVGVAGPYVFGQDAVVSGNTSLQGLLQNLDPQLRPGRFVFVTVRQWPESIEPVAMVVEDEGTTLVVDQDVADRCELQYDYVAAMITLRVHSALHSVGLTAVVASALAGAGVSCNVVAGYFHDHLFVPADRADEAVTVLRGMAGSGS
jgi:hypothetical protein